MPDEPEAEADGAAPESEAARLGGRLAEGLAALKAGRPADAVPALSDVCDGLRGASEMRDVRARALCLLAQALLGAGRPAEALQPAEAALRLARELHDTEGVAEIEALRGALVETAARTPATPSPPGRPPSKAPPVEREALLEQAGQALDAGRTDEAIGCATRALALARDTSDVRVEVLAHLMLARATPAHAAQELIAAHSLADERDEFTLVGAVARTAALLGVRLPSSGGPDPGRKA